MAVLSTRRGNIGVDPISRGYNDTNTTTWGGGWIPLATATFKYATYSALYKGNSGVWAAVNKIARGAARLPLKAYRRMPNGDRDYLKDESHPLEMLIEEPNPQMSCSRFKEWMFSDLALNGNAAAVMMFDPNGNPNAPVELWPVLWPKVEVEGRYFPEVYHVHTQLGKLSFPAKNVLHLRFAPSDPDVPLTGISPLEPLAQTVANDDAAMKWTTAMFKNAGRPSGFFVTDKNLNDAQTKALRDQAQSVHGGVENAGRMGVLSGGLSWTPMQMNVVETGLIDLRRLNREDAAAVYDIPPPLLQDLSHATFSNITEQHRMFYQGTLPPWLTLYEEEFAAQIISQVPEWSNLYIEFDMKEVLKGAPKEEAETFATERRWMTTNEIRQRQNLPRIEKPEYDEVWEPNNEAPIGQAQSQPQLPANSPDVTPMPSKALTDALDRLEHAAASTLGSGRPFNFSQERFARQLVKTLGPEAEGWAYEFAGAVGRFLADASSVEDLKARVAELREAGSMLEPPSKMADVGTPDVHVHLPEIKVALPDSFEVKPPVVNVSQPDTTTIVELPPKKKTIRNVIRDKDSNIVRIEEEEVG